MLRALLLLCGLVVTCINAYAPSAGGAGFVLQLKHSSKGTSTSSFVTIPQTPTKKEWEMLASSFSTEFWVYWDAPTGCTTDGSWDPVCSPVNNETQFIPLIARHPGNGLTNEWSHFLVQLTRTANGAVVVAWAGCGCNVPPETINGIQPGSETCGFGYKLFTDHPDTAGGPFYLRPKQWHHIAVSFDGDGTAADVAKTKMGSLYIDGLLRLSRPWDDASNNPGKAGICASRPMYYFSGLGIMNSITIGYYDNQDTVAFEGNAPHETYGFNGRIDEIKFYKGPRSPMQIKAEYDLSSMTTGMSNPLLVAYYSFNSEPMGGNCIFNSSLHKNLGFPKGMLTINDPNTPPDCRLSWNVSDWLKINDRFTIKAKRPETGSPINNFFSLIGFSGSINSALPPNTPLISGAPFEAFIFTISSISPALNAKIQSGEVTIQRERGSVVIDQSTISTLEISHNDTIIVTANCSDRDCTNLMGSSGDQMDVRDFFLEYAARDSSSTPQVTPSANLFFKFEPECDGIYDACGVCDGNNSTCQCVVYHKFRNVRMAYVLLVHMVDYLMDKIDATVGLMQETLAVVSNPSFDYGVHSARVVQQIEDLMKFYNGCLTNYCNQVFEFNSLLKTFSKKKKRDENVLPVFPEKKVEKLLAFSNTL